MFLSEWMRGLGIPGGRRIRVLRWKMIVQSEDPSVLRRRLVTKDFPICSQSARTGQETSIP